MPIIEVAKKDFKWEMAHRLMNYKGKCANIHGHNYSAEIILKAETENLETALENSGLLFDFSAFEFLVKNLLEYFDHSLVLNMNDKNFIEAIEKLPTKLICTDGEPTVENICIIFMRRLLENKDTLRKKRINIIEVTIWETDESKATIQMKI